MRSSDHTTNMEAWLPVRLLRELRANASMFARHPLKSVASALSRDTFLIGFIYPEASGSAEFVTGAATPDCIKAKPRKLLRRVLAVSASVHGVLIVYLIYIAVASQFFGLNVVNKGYRQLDVTQILAPLHYPPGIFRSQQVGPTMTLEEIQARERKRREEAARREQEKIERERAERERAEKERAEREKAERERAEQQKAAEQAKANEKADKKPNAGFGEINEAPIKDMLSKVYELYKAGQLDLQNENFSVMASFKIEKDGSLSNIRLLKSSGSKLIDKYAIEILWLIGESHALVPISNLTSNTIRLDLTDNLAKLTITGFAPNADEAKNQAQNLNFFLSLWRLAQKAKNAGDNVELLSLLRVKSDNNRVDADLTVSRSRATEMWRAKFGNNNP